MVEDQDHIPTFLPPPTHTNPYDLNSEIMLTAIISLSVVVVLVTALHIYARWVLRRQARRRAAIRQLGLAVSRMNSSTDHQDQPPKRGLDPAVIASLPIFVVYRHRDADIIDEERGTIECAVCLSFLEDDEMARLLPNCKHTFHAECIDKWLSTHPTCPICRTEAEPRLAPDQPLELRPVDCAPPTAHPLEHGNSTTSCSVEAAGTSDGTGVQPSNKIGGSSSRLSSFRRMLSGERSSRRIQSCGQEDGLEDLERQ